jgi:hypothetical protein
LQNKREKKPSLIAYYLSFINSQVFSERERIQKEDSIQNRNAEKEFIQMYVYRRRRTLFISTSRI